MAISDSSFHMPKLPALIPQHVLMRETNFLSLPFAKFLDIYANTKFSQVIILIKLDNCTFNYIE